MSDNNADYSISFTVDRTPAEAFAAIIDPRAWWSSTIEGRTDRVGEIFNHTYGDMHRCRMEVTELVPAETVTWHVLENYFSFTADATEWTGTDLTFRIAETAAGTLVTFTHVGLVPKYECYELCSDAWSDAVGGGLRRLIATGASNATAA